MISEIRIRELKKVFRIAVGQAVVVFVVLLLPTLIALSALAHFTLSGNHLTMSVAFTSLTLFTMLRVPLANLSGLLVRLITGSVANKRITTFLQSEEYEQVPRQAPIGQSDFVVGIRNCTMRWSRDAPQASLINIDLRVKSGEFVCIVGPVGSGKSSIFSCLLGDMERVEQGFTVGCDPLSLKDHVWISGTVAYTSQHAWILNDTVRNNIVFGKEFDQERYNQVLRACCLEHDLALLPAGENLLLLKRRKRINMFLSLSFLPKKKLSLKCSILVCMTFWGSIFLLIY